MHVAALLIELRFTHVHSLKEKRSVVKPIIEGARKRYNVAAAEVAHQDHRQRTAIGVSVVSSQAAHATNVLDEVERFVWSFPEVEVLDVRRSWLEED